MTENKLTNIVKSDENAAEIMNITNFIQSLET